MGAIDSDVIDYTHWARNIKGLADTTLRVRWDVLARLHAYIDTPLRDAAPGQLLRFEQAAISGRAPETRRAYCCHIRAFYRWAMQTGIVTTDPSTMLTLPRVPKHLPRPIAEDDLAIAVAAAKPKMRAILTLAGWAGLRCVEIAALDWSDLQREQDGSSFLRVQGKGGKERTVEIGETVLRALRGLGIKRRGPVFIGQDGGRMSAHSVSYVANRYLATQGVPATMHQLRHRYGTVAYQLSRDIRLVQNQMGHASPNTTAGYTRVSSEAAAAMVAAMDALTLDAHLRSS